MAEVPDLEVSGTAFTVLKQKLDLDFSFSPRIVRGKTTIEIQPQSPHLRTIQLNCRQLKIRSIRIDGKNVSSPGDIGYDYSDLYKRVSLHKGTDIYQHHLPRARIRRHAQNQEIELEISIPKGVEIVPMNAEDATMDQVAAANSFGSLGESLFAPIEVEIEYVLDEFRDGLHFVGVEDGDARYPHVYTRNSPFSGTASCVFPCVDDGITKCPFDISVRYPRTLGDTYNKARHTNGTNAAVVDDNSPKADSVMSDVDDDPAEFSEEEKGLEMSVVCSGELTDDISDPNDATRKTASFTCAVPILPQHVGIAIGPFEIVELSEYRDTQDDERLGSNAIRVHGFCLPGRAEEVRNSAMILARTLDSFTERYQSYPFEKAFKLAFVDDLGCDVAHSASLSICSSQLLFPETVWEPLEATTRTLIHAVASQWIGVNVTPNRPNDHWIIVGGSWFMTELYLRDLFGRNDHRYRHKMMADTVMEQDVRRPSLFILGEYLGLDPGENAFMENKAPLVLYILHNRLVKQSGKNGVDRCLYRLLFNARNEKLPNGIISTDQFLDICEKVGHQKLDTFFNQWVHGSGCPTFECHPTFNKKKQVIQLTIKQTQGDSSYNPEDRTVAAHEVFREAKEKANGFRPSTEWPAFVGPMTIRVHESDGTPYEHIVDINSSTVKVEIPYNTKYRRNKRNRLRKEQEAAEKGVSIEGENHDDTPIYQLGNVLQKAEEVKEWRLDNWKEDDLSRMEQESYDWLRVDADFEWICKANINEMPAYMYVAQLQQDKDVAAQIESIQWLSLKEGHPLISSILVKTLMDGRYFHGVRTLAAHVMANSAKESLGWIGLFHLKKAFRELFCIDDTLMTRSNDFSDRSTYIIQCAIPRAIARIRNVDSQAPMEVKRFLLDIMRYNDNRGNDFSDDHYLATLMQCLAQALATTKKGAVDHDPTLSLEQENEEFEFKRKAIEELHRQKRLDEWIPTYHNIYTTTALECDLQLMKSGVIPLQPSDFLQYARIGNADNVRLKAWSCIVDLGVVRKNTIIKYIINDIVSDPSPAFRSGLIRIFNTALGQIGIGEEFKPKELEKQHVFGLEIEQHVEGPSDRGAEIARKKLDGALRALKIEFANNETLRQCLEEALYSTTTSVHDVAEILEICSVFYTPVSKLPVTIKYPKYWNVKHLGSAYLRFYHSEKYRTQPKISLEEAMPQKAAPAATAPAQPKLKLHLGASKMPLSLAPEPPTPAAASPAIVIAPPLAKATPKPVPEPKSAAPTLKIPNKPSAGPLSASPPAPSPRPTASPTPMRTPAPPIVPAPVPAPVVAPPPTSAAPAPVAKPTPTPSQPPGPKIKFKTTKVPQQHPSSQPSSQPSSRTQTPAPAPAPAPAPTPIQASKPGATPRKSPPSLVVKLRLSTSALSKLTRDHLLAPGVKRKADGTVDGERSLKRQASADVNVNSHAGAAESMEGIIRTNTSSSSTINGINGATPVPKEKKEKKKKNKEKLVVKLKLGREKLSKFPATAAAASSNGTGKVKLGLSLKAGKK